MNDSVYSYTDCEIYSSVPGQYHVKMKFMIPIDDEEQKKTIDKNMARIKDFIFTNISNDTDMGTTLKKMNWKEIKAMLIDAINENSNKPVETIYLQEALILDIRWERLFEFHTFYSHINLLPPPQIGFFSRIRKIPYIYHLQ